MLIRINRKGGLGLTFENVPETRMFAGGAVVALPDGIVPTSGTRDLFDRGEVEDLQDGAPRATVRNATRHTEVERTIRLEAPWPAHVVAPFAGLERVKVLELKPGETLNVRAEFLASPAVRNMIEGGELVLEEAA